MSINLYADGGGLDPRWRIAHYGTGQVRQEANGLRLALPTASERVYSDAQITDYAGRHFTHQPPVQMTVRARVWPNADGLRGTAGFGFWNQPFVPGVTRLPRLPQAVWFFFAAPPSDMQLASGIAGHGWKAATFNAQQWRFLALLPAAPIGFLLMRVPALYRHLWPIGQRAIGVSEHLLDAALLDETHTYTLDWRIEGARFAVDGVTVHEIQHVPHRALGFIAWIDNQYAIITPQGRFRFGLLACEHEQALMIEQIMLDTH